MKLKLKLKLKLNSYHQHREVRVVPTHLRSKSFNNYSRSKDMNATIYIVTMTTICIENVPAIIFIFMPLTTNQIDNTKGEMK